MQHMETFGYLMLCGMSQLVGDNLDQTNDHGESDKERRSKFRDLEVKLDRAAILWKELFLGDD